jgi:hypothetical protein
MHYKCSANQKRKRQISAAGSICPSASSPRPPPRQRLNTYYALIPPIMIPSIR